jgi:pantoate--beta-alanine ligase
MEGEHRPGHFKGVVQVVHRLLDIVQPDCLYLGQKDFQQYTIIDFMLKVIKSNIKLVMVPIVRESDGLAMSSRNIRLSPEGRAKAPIVYQVLQEVEHYVHFQPFPTPKEAIQLAYDLLKKYGVETIDYFKIIDGYSLKTIDNFEDSDYAVACTVVKIDQVRLLDNIILYKK